MSIRKPKIGYSSAHPSCISTHMTDNEIEFFEKDNKWKDFDLPAAPKYWLLEGNHRWFALFMIYNWDSKENNKRFQDKSIPNCSLFSKTVVNNSMEILTSPNTKWNFAFKIKVEIRFICNP